ncbi:hypothetical protein Tco_0616615 [Tanacetum coccineum]
MTHRSCLRWKPTGKIFKTVGLRWVPTGKIFTSSTTKVDSKPQNGSNDDITNQYECKQTLDVSAGLAPPRQMTSDHNSSELGIHDHNNELSSSKLVPKVVPQAEKRATSRQELELLFHHHITMLRPFREDKCLNRRENQCFIVLLSGALFQPHRRRDILSFMSITKRVFKGVEIFDQREHLSEMKVFTMKMEILLEPTSNKLLVGDLCDSARIKLVSTGKKRWCDST